MRKWAVIYSSVTGNTKAVAAAMAEEAGADLFRVQDAPADLSAYEAVALGYWLRRGGPDDLMKAYLPRIQNARIALFQTHGADVGSEHAVTSADDLAAARTFVQKMEHKMDLLEKFRRAQEARKAKS